MVQHRAVILHQGALDFGFIFGDTLHLLHVPVYLFAGIVGSARRIQTAVLGQLEYAVHVEVQQPVFQREESLRRLQL